MRHENSMNIGERPDGSMHSPQIATLECEKILLRPNYLEFLKRIYLHTRFLMQSLLTKHSWRPTFDKLPSKIISCIEASAPSWFVKF